MGIVSKALNGTYSFPKSKPDMELLRQLTKGEADKTNMKGSSDFHRYTAAFNICTEFGEQLLDKIELLGPFNNRIADKQEEYMPSSPPMSSVTTSFFTTWMALDAPINDELTIGLLYLRYIREKKVMLYAENAMENLNDSFPSFYQVTGGDLERTILWDMVGKREIGAQCAINDLSVATYQPTVGDVWYSRILPSLIDENLPHVVFTSPYVFRKTGRNYWEEFFSRRNARKGEGRDGIVNYLKRGDSFGYWLEFVFQTYVGHTREVIFAEGLPDIKESRPHGDLDRGGLA